jgi:hypothetical protein
LVVIGDLVGSGESQERRIVGDTLNLAARLQAAAAPGTIVIGPTTRQLLAGLFEYRDLGEIEVKGFATPVRAYQVLQPSTVESRFEAMRTATTVLRCAARPVFSPLLEAAGGAKGLTCLSFFQLLSGRAGEVDSQPSCVPELHSRHTR